MLKLRKNTQKYFLVEAMIAVSNDDGKATRADFLDYLKTVVVIKNWNPNSPFSNPEKDGFKDSEFIAEKTRDLVIEDLFSSGDEQISETLSKLVKEGYFERVSRGVYTVTEDALEAYETASKTEGKELLASNVGSAKHRPDRSKFDYRKFR